METTPVASGPTDPPGASALRARRLALSIWQAPLLPVVIAVTAGIVLDRYQSIPLAASLCAGLVSLIAWWICRSARSAGVGIAYLAVASAAAGAAYHHWHRNYYADDDIGNFVSAEQAPAELRGVIE